MMPTTCIEQAPIPPPSSSSFPGGGVFGPWQRSYDHQRPHHVVLLVLQDVAVPHVLVPARFAGWQGRSNGTCGRSNFMMTVVTSLGCILTVSFHPSSSPVRTMRWPGVAGRAVVGVHVEWLASRAPGR